MGVNWNSKLNPESIPHLKFVPRIALPTVFGDALSYMEQVGKINAAINEVIDNMNKLGQNIVQYVAEEIEESKLPVYDELKYTPSTVPSPANWNLSNPEAVYRAIADGKMVIIGGYFRFNDAGLPIYDEVTQQYLILTEIKQQDSPSPDTLEAVFMNYNSTHIRWLDVVLYRNGTTYTSTVQNLKDFEIPTVEYVDNFHKFIREKIMIYRGTERIPGATEQYVELTNNGTAFDLSDFFAVTTETQIYAQEICPCVVIDNYSGYVGILKYGGNSSPWVRIYGTGVRMGNQLYEQVATLTERQDNTDTQIDSLADADTALNDRIDEVADSIGEVGDDVASALANCVQYTEQQKTQEEKNRACLNIGAVMEKSPNMLSPVTIYDDGHQTELNITLDRANNRTVLMFEEGLPILRNIATPLADNDAATKEYVDNNIGVQNAVQYVAQTLTETQKQQARENINAPSVNNPYLRGSITLANDGNTIVLGALVIDGKRVLRIGDEYNQQIIRGVATPAQDNDAANKAYVDSSIEVNSNAVTYVSQVRTPEQQSTARNNIHACPDFNATIFNFLVIDSEYSSVNPSINLHAVGSAYENGANIVADADNIVSFKTNEETEFTKVRFAPGVNDNDGVTVRQLIDQTAPIQLSIDAGSSQWVEPYNRTITQIANMMYRGTTVFLSYQPTVESSPIIMFAYCCDYEHIYFKGFVAGVEKTFQLNNDNSFTIS